MKIIAAIVSAIAATLYASWIIYTPINERLPHINYYSYSGIFAVNFVPNFFVFIIVGVILSPVIDSIVYKRFKLKGVKGLLTIILAYLLLGVVSGVMISIFFLRIHFISYYLSVSIFSAMIFLFFQTLLQFFFYRRRK